MVEQSVVWPYLVDPSDIRRLFTPAAEDICWPWLGEMNPAGYGVFRSRLWETGKRSRKIAHRLVWELYIGPIPGHLDLCHKCDNPACVNPSHHFIGTRKDNMQDAAAKARIIRGEASNLSRITNEQALEIREAKGFQREIAKKFGVSQALVSLIKSGKTRAWQ